MNNRNTCCITVLHKAPRNVVHKESNLILYDSIIQLESVRHVIQHVPSDEVLTPYGRQDVEELKNVDNTTTFLPSPIGTIILYLK